MQTQSVMLWYFCDMTDEIYVLKLLYTSQKCELTLDRIGTKTCVNSLCYFKT